MPIQSAKNLYPGINAHLNSYLQNEPGGWRSYHDEHVVDLRRVISEHLPPGYLARSEKGLQIAEIQAGLPAGRNRTVIPDVTVYQSSASRAGVISEALLATPPVETLPITATLTEEDYLTGLVIYQSGEGELPGRPIVRLELLSPANKPGGSHYGTYLIQRLGTLRAGLRLVEIDYLHFLPPIIPALASYVTDEDGAYPYYVLVSDPRPNLQQGKTDVYGFYTDEKLPVPRVPLAGVDTFLLDLDTAYRRTFESSEFFQLVVDYTQNPVQFEHYTPTDQARISRLLTIIRESSNPS